MYHYGASSVNEKDIENLTKFCDAINHILEIANFDKRSQVPEYDSYNTKEFDDLRKFTVLNYPLLSYS